MADTFYFSHDYNARTDFKIKKLLSKHGMLGYGIFWSLVEDLYNNANALPTDCERIAFDLRTDCETITSILQDFDLFIVSDGFFSSNSVSKRLKEREDKSNKARQSAKNRWSKDANALPTQSDRNAIKERKGKENKGKDIVARTNEFKDDVLKFESDYPSDMLIKFFNYWSEPNKSKSKMRFEQERTWELSRRIGNWASRDKVVSKKETPKEQTGTFVMGLSDDTDRNW